VATGKGSEKGVEPARNILRPVFCFEVGGEVAREPDEVAPR